jgi:hypothetical protein
MQIRCPKTKKWKHHCLCGAAGCGGSMCDGITKGKWIQKELCSCGANACGRGLCDHDRPISRCFLCSSSAAYKILVKDGESTPRKVVKVSEDYCKAVCAEPCAYCELLGINAGKPSLGMDRIVNSQGYEDGNISPCCWIHNRMKGGLSISVFRQYLGIA